MLEVAVSGDEEGMNAILNAQLASSRQEHRASTRSLFYFTKGMAAAGNIQAVMRAVLLSRGSASGVVHSSIWTAAAPCLAELGGDLAPESATAKKRAWRVFGLVAGACATQASAQGLNHTVFSTNPRRRDAARTASPGDVAATNLPSRLADAFDALSGLEPPASLAAMFEREAALARGEETADAAEETADAAEETADAAEATAEAAEETADAAEETAEAAEETADAAEEGADAAEEK
jgi:hypothetical protein